MEMGDVLSRAQALADKVGDDHISSAMWREFVSMVYGADVFAVVAGTGGRHFETKSTLTTSGVAYVSEPSNLLSLVGVDYVDAAGKHYPLEPLEAQEEAFYVSSTSSGRAFFYTLVDDRLYLYPTPPTAQTYEAQYIPQSPDVSGYADDTCLDVVTPDGELCLVWGVAAYGLVRAKQDASFHFERHAFHRQKHLEWAAERTITEGHRRIVKLEDLGRGRFDPADWRWSR